jgi:2-polyprenyl-6-methoxyphenol hydroxylase-like FAD-dependent oxidoreductase
MTADLDVLVVGAGPTGLVLGGELARRGLSVRVIDKLAAPTTHSRAIAVHARTLEIFDDLGIADQLIARGVAVGGVTVRAGGKPIVDADFAGLPTRFPFVLCTAQTETEAVLGELLARRGVRVERSCELVSLTQDATGVDAVVRGPGGDAAVRARWIVGCDGAHSAVRHAVGASFEGHAYEDVFVLADVHIGWDEPGDRALTFLAEDGVAAFFPLPGGRWRVILSATSALGEQPSEPDLRALCEQRAGRSVPLDNSVWIASFRIHCRQVQAYRHGRALLAGDAAHVHSPVGGQGMNTGMQDAHNLAWKLALVARGVAGDALLDSYHAERHAIGKQLLVDTDRVTKLGMLTGISAAIRNQLMRVLASFEPVRRRIVHGAAQLGVGYEHSPLVGEATSSILTARFGKPEAGESPTLGSHVAFSGGPAPGTWAPDGACMLASGTAATPSRLAKLRDACVFTLLLFDGRDASATGYAAFVAIANQARARLGALVQVFVVTPRTERPAELPADLDVVIDHAGALEAAYAAQTECLYLVRPDGYIGFRSQPANGDALAAHVDRVLGTAATPA